jgi:excinuclease UvrABC nuclease subunit
VKKSDVWLNWRHFHSLRAAIDMAPSKPGVYAFGQRIGHQGLPQRFEWAYVGRSDRLRNRLIQHLPQNESNSGLFTWILDNIGNLEIWFATTTASMSRASEVLLIRELGPIHNRVLYKLGK